MRRSLYQAFVAAWVVLVPSVVLAASNDPNGPDMEARLEKYTPTAFAGGSISLVWLLGIVLMVLCVAGLFKSAKRTHLDQGDEIDALGLSLRICRAGVR